MGTSKRNLNEKIKNMLKNQPNKKIEDTLPKASSIILTTENLNNVINEEDFQKIINAGIAGLKKIKSGSFNDEDLDLSLVSSDPITRERIIEIILESIERNEDHPLSDLLLKAFKLALTSAIKEDKEILDFVADICYFLVYLLIQKEVIEAYAELFPSIKMDEIDTLIKKVARAILNSKLISKIEQFINNKLLFDNLLDSISDEAALVKIGEF